MKAYRLVISHNNYDDGQVMDTCVDYTTMEEAQKALDWWKSLPESPYEYCQHYAKIVEVEVHEKFVPWISPEIIDRERAEINEYWAKEQAKLKQEAEEEEAYLEYLDSLGPEDLGDCQ